VSITEVEEGLTNTQKNKKNSYLELLGVNGAAAISIVRVKHHLEEVLLYVGWGGINAGEVGKVGHKVSAGLKTEELEYSFPLSLGFRCLLAA